MISTRHYTTKFSKLADGQRLAVISFVLFSILLPVLSLIVMQKINFVAYAGIEGPLPITPPITPPTQNYITQTFNWEPGFNTLGITVNRILWYGGAGKIKILGGGFPQYRASDLLWDLNNSFVTVPPKPFKMGGGYEYPISVIYRYNANRNIWEYYTANGYGNNFPVSPGEGYFIKSSMRGASAITGLQVLTNIYIPIPQYWSIISLPENTGLTNAESLLQRMKDQSINVDMLVKWQYGRYAVHLAGSDANNFQLVPGEGYWIRNNGDAKTFIPSNTASGSASVQSKQTMKKLPKNGSRQMNTPPALPKIKIK